MSNTCRVTEFLYAYFIHNDCKEGISFNRIKGILEKVEPGNEDGKYLYKPFYNLLRYGLIELRDRNLYGLSPSVIIWNAKYCLSVNMPAASNEKVSECYLGLKIIQFDSLNNEVGHFFDFSNAIRNIPHLRFLVESTFAEWSDVAGNVKYVQCYTDTGWKECENMQGTLFRIYLSSNRFLFKYVVKLSDEKYFQFDMFEFEKFNFAVILHFIDSHAFITDLEYNLANQIFSIKTFGFPVILERLLFINHILGTGYVSLDSHYFLSERDFKQLNRIFHNKIKII
jgi:hypothetical protein